ncbi:TrkA C-terminal domain-containing protein [Corynebacterium aurimucosum]|uniref:aspartate-alanine antiporter-like transporter n=1 Tax=Corynebacterium aurimucosum TaxID=169292 RepID=UPI00191F00E5|nr:TrkA C-terminal domain-containing protein [Corynebacterium aurimucosum]QQU95295.1 transporter protein [Corynebacterium aurimucosum]UTA71800.1 transporter protein [Corynebacterium aurimucosum]WJY70048.1 putative transporter [Corynebacterium aurimucosum]
MLALFDGNIWLSIFFVALLGTLFGMIPFGPLRFGAAGTLFVGLAIGAFIELDGTILSSLQEMGLGLFIYMQGLSAGERFFKGFSEQLKHMITAVIAVVGAAAVALLAGGWLGLSPLLSVGVFSGATTSTASLAVAQQQTGEELPAVGYSLGYPVGVAVAILLVAFLLKQSWPGSKDKDNSAEEVFRSRTIRVTKDITYEELVDRFEDQFVIATIRRGNTRTVAGDHPEIRKGDILRVLVTKAKRRELTAALGKRQPQVPFVDKRLVIENVVVSNTDIAGRTVEELNLFRRYGGRIVHVERGDEEFLASFDTHLDAGDRVTVIVDQDRMGDIRDYFGDSVQGYSQLNWIAVGGGLFLGYLIALIVVPLPGGTSFELGFALGPLITGLVLGALHRTRRVPWKVPASINMALQQWGLVIFLASVGLASSEAFQSTAFSWMGLKSMVLAAIITVVAVAIFAVVNRFLGQSETRTAGGISGIFGQPAVVNYATGMSTDSRIMTGYAATIVVAQIVKIVVIPLMLTF